MLIEYFYNYEKKKYCLYINYDYGCTKTFFLKELQIKKLENVGEEDE